MNEGLVNAGFETKVEAMSGSAEGAADQASRIVLAQAQTAPAAPQPPAAPVAQLPAAPPLAPAATHFDAAASKVVRLPQGTSLDNIEVSGKDIVLKQSDGRTIVIDNGVSNVPTLMLGDIEVPAGTLTAVFDRLGIVPGAGPAGAQASNVSSSGGNFALPNGNVGTFFGLTDLLAPTDLQFPTLEQRELDVGRRLSVGPSALSSTASVVLAETALPTGRDSGRTDEAGSATLSFNTGSQPISNVRFGADLSSLQAETNGAPGADLIWVRISDTMIIGRVGGVDTVLLQILPVSGATGGAIDVTVTVTLLGPIPHLPGGGAQVIDLGAISVVVETGAGAVEGAIRISVTDDVPVAVADTDAVAAGSFAAVGGNVIAGTGSDGNAAGADTQGADGATVTSVAATTAGGTAVAVGSNTVVAGQYGVLTVSSDGSYSYARNPGSAGGVNEVFTYTLTDGDGDGSPTTLTIAIGDRTPTVVIPAAGGEQMRVYEAGLPARGAESAGSNAAAPSETMAGTIGFSSPDGVSLVSLGGHVLTTAPQSFADGTRGTLTASYSYDPATGAGTISYSYTLLDNTAGDNTAASFAVVVSDADGDPAPAGNLVISIVDDAPDAVDDAGLTVAEDAAGTIGGNLLTNDVQGADGATLTHVQLPGSGAMVPLTTGVLVGGAYQFTTALGVYSFQANGAWAFDPAPGQANAAGISAGFSYQIIDGDGDTDAAVQPITVTDGAGPVAGAAISLVLDDQNLASGSTPAGPDFA
ncbi:hypothetical protein, partial [Bosea sp. LC85]|uniref:Ig-like domain-containing protein n=1 Tax=Bosea sp. LC85 TaxID=1502851 RepID=UPI00190F74FE